MKHAQIKNIIIHLEDVRARTGLWVATMLDIIPYINGFNSACWTLGLKGGYDDIYREVVLQRGWEWTAHGALPSMRERGLDDAAIADELLVIEIEAWKKRYDGVQDRQNPNRTDLT